MQSSIPTAHFDPHCPLTQLGSVPGPPAPHTIVHEPQCSGSVARLISQPSTGSPLQFPNPSEHENPHDPVKQTATALAGAVQLFVHDPHVAALFRSASHPSDGNVLQS